MVALVHDNSQLPNIETASILLAPARHHKLGFTKKMSIFLRSPYTTCTDKISPGMQIMYDEYNGTDYVYSRYHCFNTCIQEYM